MISFVWIVGFTISITVFMLPTIVAALKHKKTIKPILVLNILGGWTVIGWIVALVWAFAPDNQSGN